MSKRKMMTNKQFGDLLIEMAVDGKPIFANDRDKYRDYMKHVLDGGCCTVDGFNNNNTALRFSWLADNRYDMVSLDFDLGGKLYQIGVGGENLTDSDPYKNYENVVAVFMYALVQNIVSDKKRWNNDDELRQVATNFGVLMGCVIQFSVAWCNDIQPGLKKKMMEAA